MFKFFVGLVMPWPVVCSVHLPNEWKQVVNIYMQTELSRELENSKTVFFNLQYFLVLILVLD